MPKKASSLSALEVKRLTAPGRYAVGGVDGLFLRVIQSGARSWILRYPTGQKRQSKNGNPFTVYRDVGLGGYPNTSLAQAREKARATRDDLVLGIDPVAQKQQAKREALARELRNITFKQAAEPVIKNKQAEASNQKHAKQWASSLETYAYPVLGDMAVADIGLAHVMQVLEPIWENKTVTATRVRQRIESVLDWAKVHGHCEGENPARWKGNLDAVLPAPAKLRDIQHHRALPFDEAPGFMKALGEQQGAAARCLEFTILTGIRSGVALGTVWSEIDFPQKIWNLSAKRMKSRRGYRVPLSSLAMGLLQRMPRREGVDLVFHAECGEELPEKAMSDVLKRMGVHEKATVHGFRSTFRDWTSECTSTPHDVAEMALSHRIANKTEAAYRRGDLLKKRAKLMQGWADFLGASSSE